VLSEDATRRKCSLELPNPLTGLVDWKEREFRPEKLQIDWPELMRFKRSFTEPVPKRREEGFEKAGIAAFHGTARFAAQTTVQVGPETDHFCRGCGKTITNESTHCAGCAVEAATKRLISAASLGRVAARSPEARAKHGASRRRHAQACSEWDASTQPVWLTSEVFSQQVQPLLLNISTSVIRSRIEVSRWYAGKIRQGYRPHPRHWQGLAELVRMSGEN
jgi:hypothetical protein